MAVYLCMTMTSNGITGSNNVSRGNKTRARAKTVAASARLHTGALRMRSRFILETYLRSTYGYNTFLLPSIEQITMVDREVKREMMQVLLKSKEKVITTHIDKNVNGNFSYNTNSLEGPKTRTKIHRKAEAVSSRQQSREQKRVQSEDACSKNSIYHKERTSTLVPQTCSKGSVVKKGHKVRRSRRMEQGKCEAEQGRKKTPKDEMETRTATMVGKGAESGDQKKTNKVAHR